jgi:hypothetical protein
MVTADADQCQSPDSSFVICLSGDTRTHGRTENGLQDSRGTAGTPDMGLIEGDEQNSDPPIPPTVTMRSPTVSAVVAAAAKTAKPAAAATTPSSRLPAAKVPKKARNSTPTAETLRQKGTSTRADPANVVAPGAKPPAVAVAAVSPGSGTEENKAPSPRSGRKPIGLPPLKRARTVSAQPASCGKQAAPAPATVTAATKSKLPAAAPTSGAKRAHSSQSPIGLGGAALPLPPPKRARTTSTSPSAVVGGDLVKNDQEKQKRKTNKVPVPASAPASAPAADVDVLVGRKKKGNLKTSLQKEEEQQLDVPLNKNDRRKGNNSNAATAPAPAAAASEQQPQQQQPQRESRRQRSIATKKTVTVVPEWVQRANEAPQVNALLLSAVEKLKPLAADGASGVDSGAWPAWQIAGGKDKKIAAQHADVDNAKINVAEEQQGRKLRQRQDVVAKTATTTATTAIVDGKRILMNYKSKALSIPGWEAVLQTVDVAPREYEDAETVAEILELGASKRLKYNLQREYTALLNKNNIANNDRSGFALGSPGSPGMLAQGSSSQHVLNRADASLYRQGFGVSEFAARVSIAASGLTAETVEKESLVQRAKRVVHGTRSTILKNTSAIVPNADVGAVENDKEEKEEEEEKGENASKRQSGERGGGIAEKMKGRKKPKVLLHFSTIPEVPDSVDEQKRQQQQQQEPRAPFALGQAISNAVAVELRSRSALLGRGGGFNPDGLIRNKDGGIRKKPGRKPQDPNTNNNGRGGGGKKKAGGRGGGAHTAGTSSRQRNTTPAPVEKELETANTERIKPPPTVWPRVEQQFLSKGAKYENSINLNDLARSSTFNGSGLDAQLWNKLWKQQAKAAANKVPPTV